MRQPASGRSNRLTLGLAGALALGVGLVGSALASAAPKRPASPVDRAQKSSSTGGSSNPAGSDPNSTTPAAEEGHKMICRGPFQYNASGWLSVFARRSAVAAGPFGDGLAAGECGFVDRAMRAEETPHIQFNFENVLRPEATVAAVTAGLAPCALDSKCLMSVRVERSGSGWQYTGSHAVVFKKKGVRAE